MAIVLCLLVVAIVAAVVVAVAWGIARVTHTAFIYPLVETLPAAGLDIHVRRDSRNVVRQIAPRR